MIGIIEIALWLLFIVSSSAFFQLVYFRFRRYGHPVTSYFLKRTREEASEFAMLFASMVSDSGVNSWKAYAVPHYDSDVLQAISLLDSELTKTDQRNLVKSGIIGEWHVALVNEWENVEVKLGLSEFQDEFLVTSYESSIHRKTPIGSKIELGTLFGGCQFALDNSADADKRNLADEDKASEIAVSTPIGVIRQSAHVDSNGVLLVSRQIEIKSTPSIKRFLRKNSLYTVLSTISVLVILTTCIASLLQALLTSEIYKLGWEQIVLAGFSGVFSFAGGVISKKDGVVENSDLNTNVRVLGLISLFTSLTMAVVFASLTIISLLLSSHSWIQLLPAVGSTDGGFLIIIVKVFWGLLAGALFAMIWASASVLYNAAVAKCFRSIPFFSQNRNALSKYTNYFPRVACDSLVTSIWEECFFRALLPVMLHNIISNLFIQNSTNGSLFLSFLISSTLWALMHSTDFASEPVWRVLELIAVGLALSYMAASWGLFVTICAHFFYNLQVLISHNDFNPSANFNMKDEGSYA